MFSRASQSSRAPRVGKEDKPKRPLSAYNLFFQDERVKLLESLPQPKEKKNKKSHGKIGFGDMARVIADKWKVTCPSTKLFYEELAAKEKRQYALDMIKWAQEQEQEEPPHVSTRDEDTNTVTHVTTGTVSLDGSAVAKLGFNCDSTDKKLSLQEEVPASSDPLLMFPNTIGIPYQDPMQNETSPPVYSFQVDYEDVSKETSCKAAEPTSWLRGGMMKEDPSVNYNSSNSSANPSTQALYGFLEQPGMADFVTQMYNLLSQKEATDVEQSQPCFAHPSPQQTALSQNLYHGGHHDPLHLPHRPMEIQGPMHAPNGILMGSITPIEREDEEFLGDDDSMWIGDDIFGIL